MENVKKLELKHLAGYLPYKLMAQCYWIDNNGKNPEVEGIGEIIKIQTFKKAHSSNPICVEIPSKKYPSKYKRDYYYDYNEIKPILHPLLGLTKEIEIKGEKFVPYDKLKSVVGDKQWIKICDLIIDNKEYSKICDMPFWWVNLLLKWHFDIHNLIESKLAIDINTL